MIESGILLLLLVIAAVVAIVSRWLRVPYTVALVVVGLGLGSLHAIAAPALTRDVMFGFVLPALIFEAAFDLEIEEVRRDGVMLAWLAVPGVILAIVIVVLTLPPLLSAFDAPSAAFFTRQAALVFAALTAATDPVAVVALFRALDAPRRLQVIIEGESLLNDGTAIIFFTLALGAAGITATIFTEFLYIVGAAIAVGLAVGFVCAQLIRLQNEPMLEVLFTTIAAYGSFAAAERIGTSGVIATVTAGLFCGSYRSVRGLSAEARIATNTFWEYLAFTLNSLLFLAIGLMVSVPTLLAHWRAIISAYAVLTVSRVVVTNSIVAVLPMRLRPPTRWTMILTWGGLRGALSMVLALSIPETFPQRDLLITMTFGVVVLSILAQGITIGPALKLLGLRQPQDDMHDYHQLRTALLNAHSSLVDLERTRTMRSADEEMRRIMAVGYDQRIARAEEALERVRSLDTERSRSRADRPASD